MGDAQQHEGGSRGHYKLEAWKRARELVLNVYMLTRTFPKNNEPVFELVDLVSRLITGLHKHVRP